MRIAEVTTPFAEVTTPFAEAVERLSGRTRTGNLAFTRALVQGARAAGRSRRSSLGSLLPPPRTRLHLPGSRPGDVERRRREATVERLVRKLERLGNEVILKKKIT